MSPCISNKGLFTTYLDFRQHFSQESIMEVLDFPQFLLHIKSINHSIQSNDTVGGLYTSASSTDLLEFLHLTVMQRLPCPPFFIKSLTLARAKLKPDTFWGEIGLARNGKHPFNKKLESSTLNHEALQVTLSNRISWYRCHCSERKDH